MEHYDYHMKSDEVSDAPAEARDKFRRHVWFVTGKAKSPTLAKKDERDLIAATKGGSFSAAEELARRHASFLDKIARSVAKLNNCPQLYDDFYAEALISFHRTILKFDLEEHETRLATFARYRVTGDLHHYALRNKNPLAHGKSSHERAAYYGQARLLKEFKEQHGRAATGTAEDYELLAQIGGISAKAIERGFLARTMQTIPLSRVEIIDHNADTIQRVGSSQAMEIFHEEVVRFRKTLKPRDRDILNQFHKNPDTSKADLARKYDISPERVGQILRRCGEQLREILAKRGIESRADLA